jgi:hypothetical protein
MDKKKERPTPSKLTPSGRLGLEYFSPAMLIKKKRRTGRVRKGVYEARMKQLLQIETAVQEEKTLTISDVS